MTFESWPRWCKPGDPDSEQYPGWPITVSQHSLDGRKPYAHLEPVKELEGMEVVTVVKSDTPPGDALYSYRLRPGEEWSPPVFAAGTYHVLFANMEENRFKLLPQQIIP